MDKLIIEDFVYEHDLRMSIGVAAKGWDIPKFYLTLPDVSEAKGEVLREYFIGRGDTIEEAAVDYTRQISGKLLIVNSGYDFEKHIQAPKLTFK